MRLILTKLRTKKQIVALMVIFTLVVSSIMPVFAEDLGSWKAKADMPTARCYLGTAVVNGKIYAIGGHNGSSYLKTVEEYNPTTNTWTTKTDMPTTRAGLRTAVVNGKIYAIGGGNDSSVLKTVEEYNPTTNTWTTKADMPTARGHFGTAVVDGKIYAIGGWNGSSTFKTVEEYDPATNTWTTKADMPTTRCLFGIAVVNDKIYAIGGENSPLRLRTVEEYDPTTNTWARKADMPTARCALGADAVNGKIYAIGGENSSLRLRTVEEYDPTTNTWTRKADMPTARYLLGTAVVNSKIYTIGGDDNNGVFLKTVEEYTPPSTTPPTTNIITSTLITDMPKYIPNDIVPLTLKLKNTQTTDKTNSITFEVEYDSSSFEFAGSDVDTSVANGYIPFQTKLDLGQGTTKRVSITYLDISNDISLRENETVFTANFKVKNTATAGIKTFTLRPVNMLDTTDKVYNINNDNPVIKTVEIANAAVVEGYINLYLGDTDTGLNTTVLNALNQTAINDTLKNLKFTLKHNATDSGTILNGSDVFIPDENGNLAVKSGNNKVTGKFRIYTQDTANTSLTIGSVGYLAQSFNISPVVNKVCSLNTASTPAEFYPGDIGQVVARQLTLTPDGKINNIDFSAWLSLYKSNMSGTATAINKLTADFTKDGVIDNVDFSLWLATYKKLAVMGQ